MPTKKKLVAQTLQTDAVSGGPEPVEKPQVTQLPKPPPKKVVIKDAEVPLTPPPPALITPPKVEKEPVEKTYKPMSVYFENKEVLDRAIALSNKVGTVSVSRMVCELLRVGLPVLEAELPEKRHIRLFNGGWMNF